jgi:hypothetical protein
MIAQKSAPVPAPADQALDRLETFFREVREFFVANVAYIGITANANEAWAAWTDLRDLTGTADVCAIGHSCAGNRNQNIHAVKIPR